MILKMENLQRKLEAETILLGEVRRGCKKAFAKIYKFYRSQVYSTIRKQISDDAIAEELMQDVFIKIWEKKAELDLDKSFSAYLSCIANSRVVDYCRKAKRDKMVMDNLQLVATEIIDDPMESSFSKNENDFLQQAINQLSPQRKRIFTLCKLDGKSYEEVSKLIGVSTSTISDHIVKATKLLRKILVDSKVFYCILFVPFLFESVKMMLEKII